MDQNAFNFESRVHEAREATAAVAVSPPVLTVSEITGHIRELIGVGFHDVWVSGEITDFRNRTGRHAYFALKDEKSQIRAIIFGFADRKLPFELTDGLDVVCHGRVDVYPQNGSYSLIIDEIEPKGIGALQLAFEQLKKKLQAEGLFDPKYKKPIPFLPRTIGVVTSPTGAAIRDIVQIACRRCPNVNILIHPVRVQGQGAADEIAAAVTAMNERSDIDVLIVGRGGGSMEDLWAFNEEVVARAIFASRIPVVSAVGHQIDFTIADFVADVRAPTPSGAAELAVPVVAELQAMIAERKRHLGVGLERAITDRWQKVRQFRERLRDPSRRIADLALRIDELRNRLVYT
ncbi:MAG: exodeoxyribonuclease VII large subunit, partial [Deltaproteobacteria bacterium]|nr:exodeoxyribonuclease VII large subunit [Deltaproteobacteria bacterium]